MAAILERLAQTNLLRSHQRVALGEDQRQLEEQVKQPGIQQAGHIRQELRRLDKQLATQSPQSITPEERDLLAKKKTELLTEVTAGMLTKEEMRRNPAGAVHRHLSWERANKKKIVLLKNIMIQLDPDSDDPDLANLERYRPETRTAGPGASTFMADAQIPGHFAMTAAAKANWPADLPPQGTANSVLAQAQRREKTAEERAAFGARMKAAREAKQQAAAAKEA